MSIPFGEQLHEAHILVVGASQGIGLGFVTHLLTLPRVARVYATYRQPETATGLLALAHPHLVTLPMDATDEGQIAFALAEIGAITQRLDGVINCVGFLHSGGLQPEKSVRQLDGEQLLEYFRVNSIPTALLAKQVLPLLKRSDRSFFTSISAKIGSIGDNRLGGWYGYRASKAALNMFLKTIAIEYSRKSPNTTVVALHPGTTDTRLSQPFQGNVPADKLFTVERTVTQLWEVICGLQPSDNGGFFSWDGTPLPW
ncbi:MAG: SDR family NAD(P)-dependent oxidoreductase [Leptolyngbya sp. RL_3_1]|nr:SDR family NAD(P)-dependent oxidoreductase [Leptolyngbya sp. RL_3_1]